MGRLPRIPMKKQRRDLDYVVIILLVGSSLYVFFTGLIADTMGLHHFGFHSEVGYLWMVLAVVHLIQTWARVKAFVRQRFHVQLPGNGYRQSQPSLQAPGSHSPDPLGLSPGSSRSPLTAQDQDSDPSSVTHSPGHSTPAKAAREKEHPVRRNLLLAILAIATGIGFNRWVTPNELVVDLSEEVRDIGLLYHKWSQPGYGEAIDTILNWGNQPPFYKTYPDVLQINLPPPNFGESDANVRPSPAPRMDLATAITTRRSRRNYDTRSLLPLEQLSQVLYLAQGITWRDRGFRAAPSAGALYPLEIYPIVQRVEGLEPGLYHHAIQHHRLELVKPGDLRQPLISAGLNQEFLGEAHVCFVVSGIFQRTRWKYHERAYRYVLMEVGHLGQNLYLAATALGLGVCGIGAFFDDRLNQLLELDGEKEAALYLITLGETT